VIRTLFISLLIIVSAAGLYSQRRNPDSGMQNIGLVETNLVQNSKDEYSLYLSLRISYDDLIFLKDDLSYLSGVEFSCEVYDGDKLVERKSVTENVKALDYQETLNKDSFIQPVLSFKLYKSKFIIKPALLRTNTNTPLPMRDIELDLINNEKKVRPVVVTGTIAGSEFELVNKENAIPYDENSYSLLIPVPDSPAGVNVKIEQKGVTLKDTLIASVNKNSIIIDKKNGLLIARVTGGADSPVSYIKIDLPRSIDEGDLQIWVDANKKKILYNISVIWFGKPFVLNDVDLAVKLLKIITDGKSAEFIDKQPSDKRYELLKKEWNRMTKSEQNGGMNTLMKEFYTRADYALANFSYDGKPNGAESDRGKVYMQFGRPTNIERNYNDKNEIIEIWNYDYLNREFIFEDTTGKGNYTLRK
jgi:GWxTD domain-containing protein